MGTLPEVAAAHFAAIEEKARFAREKIDLAAETDPGDDVEPWIDADEAIEDLLSLILESPASMTVTLALAAPAGAA